MSAIWLGIGLFVLMVLLLALIVLAARALLLPSLPVTLRVNEHATIAARTGDRLLGVLNEAGIAIPAACGGAGTCGQCRVTVIAGGGETLPTETARLSHNEVKHGLRLACQVVLRQDLQISVADALLNAERWDCRVVSSRTVAPLIRELVLELPQPHHLQFHPGAFVQVDVPAYQCSFADIDLAAEHRPAWDKLDLQRLVASTGEPTSRAYSIANVPADGNRRIVLLVRLALPPPNQAEAPPGVVSSYLFARRADQHVSVSGPFGDFRACQSQREMIFVGGGVGMAPLRAMIADQLQRAGSQRRISFWYGARSRIELFYQQQFEQWQASHANFTWTVALSDPATEDGWDGPIGFIHEVLLERYLKQHPAPEDCEYYLCGPPLMIKAVLAMLDEAGVAPENIFNDDFGT